MGPLLVLLAVVIPVICTFFYANGAVWSPSTLFFAGLLLWGLFNTRVWGMAATLDGTSAFSILTTAGVSVGGLAKMPLLQTCLWKLAWY